MRIRALLAALVFLFVVMALASPANAHHRPGHTGGPGSAEERTEDDGDEERESSEGRDAYGHGSGEEEEQGAGVGISLAVIAGAVVLIAAVGLKPGGSAPAHS